VLYLIGCSAPPVLGISGLIVQARERGWDPCLVLTPGAARLLEPGMPRLTSLTGHPVHSEYPNPGQPGKLPRANAMLVAPATSNTINKLAAGISDTLALGLVNEAIARGLPVALLASLGHDRAHPAFPRSAATLRSAGVKLLLADRRGDVSVGAGGAEGFPWQLGLAALPDPRGGLTATGIQAAWPAAGSGA
jgi:hypothetical protein